MPEHPPSAYVMPPCLGCGVAVEFSAAPGDAGQTVHTARCHGEEAQVTTVCATLDVFTAWRLFRRLGCDLGKPEPVDPWRRSDMWAPDFSQAGWLLTLPAAERGPALSYLDACRAVVAGMRGLLGAEGLGA